MPHSSILMPHLFALVIEDLGVKVYESDELTGLDLSGCAYKCGVFPLSTPIILIPPTPNPMRILPSGLQRPTSGPIIVCMWTRWPMSSSDRAMLELRFTLPSNISWKGVWVQIISKAIQGFDPCVHCIALIPPPIPPPIPPTIPPPLPSHHELGLADVRHAPPAPCVQPLDRGPGDEGRIGLEARAEELIGGVHGHDHVEVDAHPK